MKDYIGKICPYCKTGFVSGDEVVVCSECEMPHHKDCWVENQGCTTFGCLGTINSADSSVENTVNTPPAANHNSMISDRSYVYCTQCGTRHTSDARFCTQCGTRLVALNNSHGTMGAYSQGAYANVGNNGYIPGWMPYNQPYNPPAAPPTDGWRAPDEKKE